MQKGTMSEYEECSSAYQLDNVLIQVGIKKKYFALKNKQKIKICSILNFKRGVFSISKVIFMIILIFFSTNKLWIIRSYHSQMRGPFV